jgi:GAF domain-containing protein
VLDAIVRAAGDASGAQRGWLLRAVGDELRVVAAAGDRAGSALGVAVPADRGSAGFAVASGQPLAVVPRTEDDQFAVGVAAAMGDRPASLLCVPCGTDDGVLGALEVIDKQDGGRFSIDDVEVVTLLGGIAGPALADEDPAVDLPSADELGGELRRLAEADPPRYAGVATILEALLARG